MKKTATVTHLFLDIGGVLLSDGWDHHSRRRAATLFGLDWAETEGRHKLCFDAHEQGRLTMEDYLDRVIFNQPRTFTRDQFRRFMFAQSNPHTEMLELISRLKTRYGLKITAVSNEGRELNAHRIGAFHLRGLVDSFISSCFVHKSKPDPDIFRLALDVTQAPVDEVLYIDDMPLFIEVAEGIGIRGITHVDCASTRERLALLGLRLEPGALHEAG